MLHSMVTMAALQQMKRDGTKIVGVVVYDYQMARIVDRAGVDIVSVGDSVGVNMWGQESELDVTLDQMLLACKAVRRGVTRALVSCDVPYGPLQEGPDAAVRAATRLMKDGGADMVKLDAAAEHPEEVRAVVRAGIPVWAQFGITPHTAKKYDTRRAGPSADMAAGLKDQFVAEAQLLEDAGAALLDFTNSGPVAGPAVTSAFAAPVTVAVRLAVEKLSASTQPNRPVERPKPRVEIVLSLLTAMRSTPSQPVSLASAAITTRVLTERSARPSPSPSA